MKFCYLVTAVVLLLVSPFAAHAQLQVGAGGQIQIGATTPASLPYSSLTGVPTIPSAASWPNAGTCGSGLAVTGLVNGSAPTCSAINFSQIVGVTGSGTGSLVLQNSPTINNPTLTGVPTAPTNTACSADNQIATGAYIAQCASATGSGSSPGTQSNSASILASMTSSSNANSSVGTAPTRKAHGNCYTGYDTTTHTLQPTTNGGNLYCTQAIQSAAVAAGGPSLGYVATTYSGLNIAAFSNGNGAGGTYSPLSVTASFGGTGTDAFCTGDTSASVSSGVAGLTLPGCVSSSGSLYSQTTGSGADTDTLYPTSWVVSGGDQADHLVRETWWRVNNLSTLQNLEFDTNYHPSTSDYYGWGWQYNNQTGKKMFQYCPQECTSWTTVKLVDPTGVNPTITTYALVQGHVYHTRIYMHRGSTSSCTAASTTGCFYYDQLYLEDVTAGAPGVLYNIVGATSGLTPSGIPVSYPTWTKNQFTLQWQLDMNTANASTSVDVDSDTLTAYYVTSSQSGPTVASETVGNLAECDFDGSDSNCAMTPTSTPTLTASAYTSPNAMDFNAATEYETVSITPATSAYFRFMMQANTNAASTVQVFAIYNGTTALGNLYLNSANQYLTFYNIATAASTVCATTSYPSGSFHLVELYWAASATTGAFTVKIDGATTCSVTNVNTGTAQVNAFRFGELNAVSPAWDISFDNVGAGSSSWLGSVSFISTSIPTYQPYLTLTKGATLTSASSVTPLAQVMHVAAGSVTAIDTITPPTVSNCNTTGNICSIRFIPDFAFTLTTAGNIVKASTGIVGRVMELDWDPDTSKWYPSY